MGDGPGGHEYSPLVFLLDAYDEARDTGNLDKRTVTDWTAGSRRSRPRPCCTVARRRPITQRRATWRRRCANMWNTDFDDARRNGRRYRRQDEMSTRYCVTVDLDTLDDQAVTIRDRDTMQQSMWIWTA